MFHALAVPERRGLRDDGAEDSGGAEEDEGSAHGALPCLVVEIGGFSWASCQGGKNGLQGHLSLHYLSGAPSWVGTQRTDICW